MPQARENDSSNYSCHPLWKTISRFAETASKRIHLHTTGGKPRCGEIQQVALDILQSVLNSGGKKRRIPGNLNGCRLSLLLYYVNFLKED